MKIILALLAAALTASAFSVAPSAHSTFHAKGHKAKKHKGNPHHHAQHS
jgi:Spy/CpxP family protein refolding chaperone